MDKKVIKKMENGFKNIQQELRELDLQWINKLCTQIKEDPAVAEEMRSAVTERKIYNVFNGVVRNGSWKVLVFEQAKVLRDALKAKLVEATR